MSAGAPPSWEQQLSSAFLAAADRFIWESVDDVFERVVALRDALSERLRRSLLEEADIDGEEPISTEVSAELAEVLDSLDEDELSIGLQAAMEWLDQFSGERLFGHLVFGHGVELPPTWDYDGWLLLHRSLHLDRNP